MFSKWKGPDGEHIWVTFYCYKFKENFFLIQEQKKFTCKVSRINLTSDLTAGMLEDNGTFIFQS